MRREAIRVTITQDGRATVAVDGVSGPSCESLTKNLERTLGVARDKQRKSEYYQTSPTAELIVQKGPDN
jgi:hypothetical protein